MVECFSLSVSLSLFLSVSLFRHLSTELPFQPSTYLPVYSCIYRSICLFTYLLNCLSFCLSSHSFKSPTPAIVFENATKPSRFSHLSSPDVSAPAALASLLFDPPQTQNHETTQCFATFLPFRAPASSFF